MSYINTNINLIPNIKINVPTIDRDIFIDGIIEYLKANFDESNFHLTFPEIKDALIFDEDLPFMDMEIFVSDSIELGVDNVYMTTGSYNNVYINSFLGVNTLSNGLTYLGMLTNGDEEKAAIRIIYFDGNTFRSYVPHYGNCINWNTDSAFGIDEDEDEDYLLDNNLDKSTFDSLKLEETIDTSMIIQELETVFQLQGVFNGTILWNNTSNNTSCNTSNNSSSNSNNSQVSITDVLLKIFEQKNYALILNLQKSLLQQGFTSYDKNLCWKNLKDKNIMLKDIYNYIISFDCNGDNIYKFIECQKIVTYIKKYKYKFEGYLY